MAYINNKLKNKLRQESPLPEDFNFDAMKEGIYAKMPPQAKKRRRILVFWWIFPILLFSGVYFMLDNKEKLIHTGDENLELLPSSTPILKLEDQEIAEKADHNAPHHGTEQSKVDQPLPNNDFIASSNITGIYQREKQMGLSNTKEHQTILEKATALENQVKPMASLASHNDITNRANIVESYKYHTLGTTDVVNDNMESNEGLISIKQQIADSKALETIDFSYIDVLPLKPIQKLEKSESFYPKSMGTKTIPISNQSIMSVSIEAGSGWVTWNAQNGLYNNFQNTEHSAKIGHNPNDGYQIFLHSDLIWANRFYISMGIDFLKRYSVFEYEGQQKGTVELENQLVRIEQNALSGVRTEIYGTNTTTTIIDRKMRKNSFDYMVNLPLMAGYQVRKNNWGFQAGFGFSANIFSQHEGYTFANNSIVSFSGQHPLWSPRFDFNFESQLKVKYQIGRQIFVGTTLRYSKALNSQPLTDFSVIRPQQLTFAALMGYNF